MQPIPSHCEIKNKEIESLSKRRICQHGRQPEVSPVVKLSNIILGG